MSVMLEIRNLVKCFGPLTAVDGISFSVKKGEVLGFLGPNGAGKSTTMKVVTGFLHAERGSVTVCGHDVEAAPLAARRHIGYLPEGAPAYADMTPDSYLAFIAEVRGLEGAAAEAAIERAIDLVSLQAVRHQVIDTLSKGFKRRVGLAQAILPDPDVLILDEPTDGLDPNQKHDMRVLIRRMSENKAIVISTHILEEVEAVCSRAVIIDRGRIVADGTPAELLARAPGHNAVTIVLDKADAAAAAKALKALDGIAKVVAEKPRGGTVRLRIAPRDGRPVLAPVSAALHEGGWTVGELGSTQGSLDDVFHAITTGAA